MSSDQQSWDLESFLDSLILELDRAQDTLAVKGMTRRLTYTVQDLSLDMNVFINGNKFTHARPGDTGASRISLKLGSISDQQIRENANTPISREDITFEALDELDDEVKQSLEKVGVHSSKDLEQLEKRNIDVEKLVERKTAGKRSLDYDKLAGLINRARRQQHAPTIRNVSASQAGNQLRLRVQGDNLLVSPMMIQPGYPKAFCNQQPVSVIASDHQTLDVELPGALLQPGHNPLHLALDPFAVLTLDVNQPDQVTREVTHHGQA